MTAPQAPADTEVPTGNTYDKYGSTNPVVRRLMARFEGALDELFAQRRSGLGARRRLRRGGADDAVGGAARRSRGSSGSTCPTRSSRPHWRAAQRAEPRVHAPGAPSSCRSSAMSSTWSPRSRRSSTSPIPSGRSAEMARVAQPPPARLGPPRAAVADAQRRPRRVRARSSATRPAISTTGRERSFARLLGASWRADRGPLAVSVDDGAAASRLMPEQETGTAVREKPAAPATPPPEPPGERKGSYASSARILSIGIASTGIFTFLYLAFACHELTPAAYARISLCWAVMFVILSVIYRPIEQLLSRTIADRRARGLHGHPLRVPALIQSGFALLFLIVALALRPQIENDMFDGSSALYWILVVGVLAYAASYFARGLARRPRALRSVRRARVPRVDLAVPVRGRGRGRDRLRAGRRRPRHGGRAVRVADGDPVRVLAGPPPRAGRRARRRRGARGPRPRRDRGGRDRPDAPAAAPGSRSRSSGSCSPSRR